jgi:hypothetical protein
MDNRVINTNYSVAAMQLFVKVTNLCLSVPASEGAPNPPFIVFGTNSKFIGQIWGESPPTGGTVIYWQLAEDGETVHMWDPEIQEDHVLGESAPLHAFKLAEMNDFITKWQAGDI